jgi:hypothetical protein
MFFFCDVQTRARLGIYVKQIGTDIYIQEPNDLDTLDSMCLMEVAGIKEGDVLVGIDGEAIAQVVRSIFWIKYEYAK